jgi:hypothetical protein
MKRFANRPELHLRHTNAANPHAIDQSELDRVVQDGHAVVAKFIEQRYRIIKGNA